MRVFRINAVGKDGRAIVLGTADTAVQALRHIQDALGEYTRAWVTDEHDMDVLFADLTRMAEEERSGTEPINE
jgi:hypothetical protein